MIKLEIPYPPTTNHLFVNVGKRRVKSESYKAWLDAAGWMIAEQGRPRIRGHVSLSIALVRPDNRKRDLSNTIKSVEDLFVQMGVIEDDSLIQRLSVQWVDGVPGQCVVLIQEAEQGLAA